MRRLATIISAFLLAAFVPAASAADSLEFGPATASPKEFDWNGFYAGVYGVTQFSPLEGAESGIGITAGVNTRLEFVLIGAEVAVHGLHGAAGLDAYVQTLGRAGVAVTDEVLLYGAGGLGIDVAPGGGTDALLGGGVEIAVSDGVSLRGQYLRGFDLTGANPTDQVSVGASFHF